MIVIAPYKLASAMSLMLIVVVRLLEEFNAMEMIPPHWIPPPTATIVHRDYSWLQRQTGITPQWKVGRGYWSHYTPDDLKVPWTSGKMLKFLRKINDTAFELHSVYQPQAVGGWLKGFINTRPIDGNQEHKHTFLQTPHRQCESSRVTIVQPSCATFVSTSHGGFEMWLAETVDGMPEARKIGLYVEYGKDGALSQVFRIQEYASNETMNPQDEIDFETTDWPDEPDRTKFLLHPEYSQGPCHARMVHFPSPSEPEVAWTASGDLPYYSPVPNNDDEDGDDDDDDDLYHVQECYNYDNDGMYICIPKRILKNEEMHLELGCVKCSGQMHRLVAFGKGCPQNLVYECWER
jgi:hypothetical protein